MAAVVKCNIRTANTIRNNVITLSSLIHECRWIIDAYVSDFYTLDHWKRLPSALQNYFDLSQPPEWAWMLAAQESDLDIPHSRVVPLSLLALQCCVQAFSLKRIAVDLDSDKTVNEISHALTSQSDNVDASCGEQKPLFLSKPFQAPHYKNGQCMDMQHIFRKHVKPKKQHEIQKLGQTINLLCKSTHCENVVDVGAGLGHLSRLLSFQHGLRVTTVEAADGHAPKAVAYDREMKKDILKKRKHAETLKGGDLSSATESASVYSRAGSKSLNSQEAQISKVSSDGTDITDQETLPNHVVCMIQPDIASTQFLDIIMKTQEGDDGSKSDNSQFVLAGLHACGDLTPTLLRVFVECQSAIGLASVACCYMKMNATSCEECMSEDAKLSNFPMSDTLKSKCSPSVSLSYEAREMACHFADAYRSRLKSHSEHLKIHSYRAALQYLLVQVKPDFKSGEARFVSKKGAAGTFSQYAEENVKKAGIDFRTVPIELIKQCEEMTLKWQRVVAFYTLRLSLAPAVETLMLLDRMLFLLEQGIPSVLLPIFDSSISPRNFALLAVKS